MAYITSKPKQRLSRWEEISPTWIATIGPPSDSSLYHLVVSWFPQNKSQKVALGRWPQSEQRPKPDWPWPNIAKLLAQKTPHFSGHAKHVSCAIGPKLACQIVPPLAPSHPSMDPPLDTWLLKLQKKNDDGNAVCFNDRAQFPAVSAEVSNHALKLHSLQRRAKQRIPLAPPQLENANNRRWGYKKKIAISQTRVLE